MFFQYPEAENVTITFRLQEKRKDENDFIPFDMVEIFHGGKQSFKDEKVTFSKQLSTIDGNRYRVIGEVNKPNFTKAEFNFEKEHEIKIFPGIYLNT